MKAGEKGGEETAESHGKDSYEKIGKKGGETVAEEKGPDFYEKIGRRGGNKWNLGRNQPSIFFLIREIHLRFLTTMR